MPFSNDVPGEAILLKTDPTGRYYDYRGLVWLMRPDGEWSIHGSTREWPQPWTVRGQRSDLTEESSQGEEP